MMYMWERLHGAKSVISIMAPKTKILSKNKRGDERRLFLFSHRSESTLARLYGTYSARYCEPAEEVALTEVDDDGLVLWQNVPCEL